MDKEKEIERLTEILLKHSKEANVEPIFEDKNGEKHELPPKAIKVINDILEKAFIPFLAEIAIEAGYRKADEVRKEYEEEIMVLTAQVDVLQSERDNLMRTLEEANEELQADAFLEALKGEKND